MAGNRERRTFRSPGRRRFSRAPPSIVIRSHRARRTNECPMTVGCRRKGGAKIIRNNVITADLDLARRRRQLGGERAERAFSTIAISLEYRAVDTRYQRSSVCGWRKRRQSRT